MALSQQEQYTFMAIFIGCGGLIVPLVVWALYKLGKFIKSKTSRTSRQTTQLPLRPQLPRYRQDSPEFLSLPPPALPLPSSPLSSPPLTYRAFGTRTERQSAFSPVLSTVATAEDANVGYEMTPMKTPPPVYRMFAAANEQRVDGDTPPFRTEWHEINLND